MRSPVYIGEEQVFKKIRHFCAYQERCHSEVKEKLAEFGIRSDQADKMISDLIAENFLNEERYAIAYAGGKFRMKQWGKMKIRYELKKKMVSEYCIRKGLDVIDDNDYHQTIAKLFETKMKSLRSEKNLPTKKRKIQSFLLQKGYESSLINEFISLIEKA